MHIAQLFANNRAWQARMLEKNPMFFWVLKVKAKSSCPEFTGAPTFMASVPAFMSIT